MANPPALSELETDLLNEIFNLGVGNAAASLSQMVRQEIKLSVPELNFYSINELSETLGQDQLLSCVSQKITGAFSAQSMVIFPDEDSLEIVSQLLGENFSEESLAELQDEAMSEIGNIVLNACIGSLSESLSTAFEIDLPEYVRSIPTTLIENKELDGESLILFIRIELTLSESKITGYLAFLMGVESLSKLHNILKETLNKLL